MDSYRNELERLRPHFERMDPKSPESIKEFFNLIPHLKRTDIRALTGADPVTIKKWSEIAGHKPKKGGKPPGSRRITVKHIIPVPENWRTAEWLTYAYQMIGGVKPIARLIGTHHRNVQNYFKKFSIPVNTDLKRPHPYRTREWLTEHYVNQRQNQKTCAELAGVSRATIVGWLTEFKIPVRDVYDVLVHHRKPDTITIRLWARKLRLRIKTHNIVRGASQWGDRLIVYYASHIKETYWLHTKETKKRAYLLKEEDAEIRNVPRVYQQYPSPYGPSKYPIHYLINRKDWNDATLIEKHLAFHTLYCNIRSQWWHRPELPDDVVRNDFEAIRRTPPGAHTSKSIFKVHLNDKSFDAPGWSVMMHYFDLYEYMNQVWSSKYTFYYSLKDVTKSKREITTTEVIKAASARSQFNFIPPTFWIDVFKQLNTKSVLDLHPGFGSRAIACAILGIPYMTTKCERFEKAIEWGFLEFSGIKWKPYDGSTVNLVVADNGFTATHPTMGMEYADVAERILGFVKSQDRKQAFLTHHPESILRVKTKSNANLHDEFYLW